MSNKHEPCKIVKIEDEARDIKTFEFDRGPYAKPGNFVMVWLPGISENPLSVRQSIPFTLTVKNVGENAEDFTPVMFKLKPGDIVHIRGPKGNSFLDYFSTGKKYIVGGGTGTIPLAHLIEYSTPQKIDGAFLGAKTEDEILFKDVWKKYLGSNVFVATEDGSEGKKGIVTDLFDEADIEESSQFFICGPDKMIRAVAAKLKKYTEPKNIIFSLERYMKCGDDLCGGCEINGYTVCGDGPVFSYAQIPDFSYKREKSGKRVEL